MRTEDVTPGEIECCPSCVAYAQREGIEAASDLEFMRLWHCDHTLNPELHEHFGVE